MKKIITILLCLLMATSLVGCSSDSSNNSSSNNNTIQNENDNSQIVENNDEDINSKDDNPVIVETTKDQEQTQDQPATTEEEPVIVIEQSNEIEEKYQIDEGQLNKIAMLNYLSFLAEEIHGSPNGKLYLEQVIDILMNDFNPSTIDKKTQERITRMIGDVQNLKMVDIKRERLSYIYEQNKSMSLKHALPSPMSILNVVQSKDKIRAVVAVLGMALDAKASYDNYTNQIDLQYLQDGWELEDEAEGTIIQMRTESFNYMVTTANEYGIKDKITLNEHHINEFVNWKNDDNVKGRITFLKANEEKYEMYSEYWLLLATSYYEDGKYPECIEAIDKYISIKPTIFRTDSQYAATLPYAIGALPDVLSGDELVAKEAFYVDELFANTDNEDFALRYFAALTYMDLYAKTKNNSYLEKAYDIAKNNVNNYVRKQQPLNEAYLNDVEQVTIGKDVSKKEKAELENYNKMLKEIRKTELPPVDATLLINIQLMLNLAEELKIDSDETDTINGILHNKGKALFLVESIDNAIWFGNVKETKSLDCFKKSTLGGYHIELPASYVTASSKVKVTVTHDGVKTIYDEWSIDSVNRNKKKTANEFTADYKCDAIKKVEFSNGDTVIVEVYPYEDFFAPITTKYTVLVNKKMIGSETILTVIG